MNARIDFSSALVWRVGKGRLPLLCWRRRLTLKSGAASRAELGRSSFPRERAGGGRWAGGRGA